MNYYNDNSPEACAWLRELIAANLIPNGYVDCRDIETVRASDLVGYTQCHFFAGSGGWPYALQLSGWPEDQHVWTGSCPCQPLSCAGKRGGEKDERHLWPEFYRLISECRPPVVFGEQVASKDGLEWLDGISLDLEELGYAVGSSDLPASCVGAPHIRQRAFWGACWVGDTAGSGQPWRDWASEQEQGSRERCQASHWSNYDLIPCRDGKTRRIESGTFPMAHGIPGRVGLLRGYGNAIVPQVAAQFIQAFCEATKTINQ